ALDSCWGGLLVWRFCSCTDSSPFPSLRVGEDPGRGGCSCGVEVAGGIWLWVEAFEPEGVPEGFFWRPLSAGCFFAFAGSGFGGKAGGHGFLFPIVCFNFTVFSWSIFCPPRST